MAGPKKPESCMKLVKKWQQESPSAEESPFASDDTSSSSTDSSIGQNRKILVVDDNPVVLKAFGRS